MGYLVGESEYNCPYCEGEGDVECIECGTEHRCDQCDGTGWNPEMIDIAAFEEAHRALNEKMSAAGCYGLTWEWINKGQRLGRSGGNYGRVAVADFLLDKESA